MERISSSRVKQIIEIMWKNREDTVAKRKSTSNKAAKSVTITLSTFLYYKFNDKQGVLL